MKNKKVLVLAISILGICAFFISAVYSQPGCFNFDDGTIQNWTIDQLYETATGNTITKYYSPLVLSNTNKQLYAGAAGYPNNYFLIDQSVASADFYFESPDLSNNSNWQNIDGYKIDLGRLFYSKCWNPTGKFFAQVQMRVIDTSDNNKVKLFAEYSGGNYVFHPMDDYSGTMKQITWKPSFLSDPKYKVKQVRIRISGLHNGGNGCW